MKEKFVNDALSAFSEETLTEMAMEDVEGGADLGVNIPCGTKNDGCGATNNCSGANCLAGCGIAAPDQSA